jgi:hypothetical protein
MVLQVLLAASLLVACAKEEPPPEPLGCKQAKSAFDKVDAGFALLAGKTAHVDKDAYCTKLQGAVKAADAVSLMLFAEGMGSDAKAKAAAAIRSHTTGFLSAADGIAARCPQEGIAGTQAALKAQLTKARAAVEASCAEK